MVSPVVESALQEMQRLAAEASGSPLETPRLSRAVGEGTFADEFRASIMKVNELQQAAKAQSRAFQAGDTGVSLAEVMIDGQKASIAFQSTVQVRNRLLTAYKEIMNMQV